MWSNRLIICQGMEDEDAILTQEHFTGAMSTTFTITFL